MSSRPIKRKKMRKRVTVDYDIIDDGGLTEDELYERLVFDFGLNGVLCGRPIDANVVYEATGVTII